MFCLVKHRIGKQMYIKTLIKLNLGKQIIVKYRRALIVHKNETTNWMH